MSVYVSIRTFLKNPLPPGGLHAEQQNLPKVAAACSLSNQGAAWVWLSAYLLGAGLLQLHPQAAGIPLVVGHQLPQRGERHLVRDKVGADGRALDAEVEDFPLAAG